jgi:hypothetical protein
VAIHASKKSSLPSHRRKQRRTKATEQMIYCNAPLIAVLRA